MILNLNSKIFSKKFFPYLTDYSHRWECYCGSAGSGKSYFIAQKLLVRALKEPITILVCRRYGTTIRNSVFSLFQEIIKKWKLEKIIKVNESDFRLIFNNNSKIIFTGLDEESKLLSLNDISCIWLEEATEVSQDMTEQLNLRMRGKAKDQQIIMSWNPISKNHWLYEFTQVKPPESFAYIHSTYKDNKWLSADYIRSIEELKYRNPNKWRIYGLGEWGIDTDGLVLSNWETASLNVQELAQKYPHRCGMDFGYQDPSAIVESFYDEETKTIYVCQCFYKTGQTLDQLYNEICNMHIQKAKIQCDAAEPRTIDFFRRKNINAVPCTKGQNSVQARIAFLQNHKIIIDESCTDFITEISNFSYEKDKQTGKFKEDKYTHEFSHSIDALGYAYSDIYTKGKLRTIDKSILGL